MALKLSLLSFQVNEHNGLKYDEELAKNPCKDEQGLRSPNSIQPIVMASQKTIKNCLMETMYDNFFCATECIKNFNNKIVLAYLVSTHTVTGAGSDDGGGSTVATIKYYHLCPSTSYKISIELEQLFDTRLPSDDPDSFTKGLTNKQIDKLVESLDKAFKLAGKIEQIPILKRGRVDKPHYLVSSDERVLEYDFDRVLYDKVSDFQDIKILHSPSLGNVLLLDKLQNLAEKDIPYTLALMNYGKVNYTGKDILILGGGDGGLLHELLKENPKMVTMIDIDKGVVDSCREHMKPCGDSMKQLEGPQHNIIIGDCLYYLRKYAESERKFDVIFNDLTDIPISKRPELLTCFSPTFANDNPWHFIEVIFSLSLRCLAPDGLYMNHAIGSGCTTALRAYEDFLDKSPIKVKYERHSAYVPSFMEDWVFYQISKANTK